MLTPFVVILGMGFLGIGARPAALEPPYDIRFMLDTWVKDKRTLQLIEMP